MTRLLLSLVCFAALAQNTISPGAISGIVVDGTGRPIPGGKFSYTKLTEYARDKEGRIIVKELGSSATATAALNGTFTLSGLTPGRYQLCGFATQPNQVSDCVWRGVPVVNIGPGQSIKNSTTSILAATILTLQINDPNGKIAIPDAHGNVAAARRFFIGVSAGTYYRRADRISATATQHVFRVLIPKRQAVHLFMDTNFAVTDSLGKSLETRRPTSIQIVPGDLDQLIFAATVN